MKGWAAGVTAATGAAIATTMLPWPEIFKDILGQGGVPPALFLLVVGGLVAAVVTLAVTLKKERAARDQEREAYAGQMNALQEKRLEETKEMLKALERTGTALTTHTVALEARTVTLNELVKGVEHFARAQEENRRHFEGVAKRLEEGIAAALTLLRGA